MKKSLLLITILMNVTFCLLAQNAKPIATNNQNVDIDNVPLAVQSSITKAVNQAVQEEDMVLLSNPSFDSYFSTSAVSLSPKGNEMSWTWQLKDINGIASRPVLPSLREAYNREYVDYNRGNITERYVFHRGNIEQRFIVAEQPEAGDLTIEGTIYADGTFSEQEDHWLWSNDHSSVKLGQLYVYDANGTEIEANYNVACDYATIIITEEALANATFPVTIDPEIGPDDFRISVMGPNGNSNFDALRPAVSYNSQEDKYLVVWDGDDNSGALADGKFEIYGQYINADGSEFFGRFRISFMGEDNQGQFDGIDPDVSYNPVTNQHLVVWRGDDSTEDELEIWGQFVDNFTQLVGDNFQISETGVVINQNSQIKNGPAITYNQTDDEFLVAWSGDAGGGESEVFGQIMSGTGAVLSNDFQISEQGPDGDTNFPAGQPDVIHNSQENEYLVVWQGQDNAGQLVQSEVEIYGQLLSNAGVEIVNDFRISDMGNDGQGAFDAISPAVAYNSNQNEYLVVWAGDDGIESDFQIYAQLLDATGTEIGDNDVRITDMDEGAGNSNSANVFSAENPSLSYSPIENKYLVIWDGDNGGDQLEAFGQVLGPSLKELAPNDFRISTIDDIGGNLREIRVNALAYNSTDGTFLSVWSGEDTGENEEFEIFGQLLDISTIKPIGQFVISNQGTPGNASFDAFDPAIAYNSQDSNYLVVWAGIRSVSGSEFEIFGQLISDEGIEIGADFRISDVGGTGNGFFDANTPDVAYNVIDNNYLVVWSADDGNGGPSVNEEFEIYGQFIDECGNGVGTNDFRISNMGPNRNINFDAVDPSVAYNSAANNFLVVWEGDDNTGALVDEEFEIFGQIVAMDGPLFNSDQRYSDMGPDGDQSFDAMDPDVIYNANDDEYLVVWDGDDDTGALLQGENEIFGQRVSALGQEIGSDFQISDQGFLGNIDFDAFQPAISHNSTDNEYLVVWEGDFDSGNAVDGEFEIFGQLLDNTGIEIGSDFRISDSGVDGDRDIDAERPSISYNSVANNYGVFWDSEETGSIGEVEIYGQFISAGGVEVGDNDFRVSQMGPDGDDNFDALEPAVAFNPLNNNFLVVWEGDDDLVTQDEEFEIFGELVPGINDCITDDIAPVPDVAMLPDVTEECSATLTPPTATDNCAGTITATTTDPLTYTTEGTFTVAWTYDDGNGNTSTQNQTVIIEDAIAPVPTVASLPDVTEECSATVTPPTATDNCAGTITATTSDPLTYTTQGTFTIEWTYDDGNGNVITQQQIININDTSAPVCPEEGATIRNPSNKEDSPNKVKSFVLPNVTAECAVTIVVPPTAFDNCAGRVTGTTEDPLTYSTQGTFTITWTFDDGNGNSISVEQTVVITDDTAPTIVLNGNATTTVDCDATSFEDPGATPSDNCDNVTVETTGTVDITTPGSYTLTYKAIDVGGNESSVVTRTVIVPTVLECSGCAPGDDMTAPVPDVANLPTASGDCPLTVTAPTATDNCSGSITATTSDAVTYTGEGTFTIVWTYDDGNGNMSTQNQTVVVDDTTAPEADVASLSDATGECTVTVSTVPTATDNCEGSITATTVSPLTYTEQGTFTIVWTYDDDNGNTSTQNQTVIVDDTTAPIPVVPSLPNATGECAVTVTAPTATDNCEGSIIATTSNPLTYTEQGTFSIVWTYDDGNGNTSTQNQTVIVDDTTAPVPVVPSLPNATGECAVTVTAPTATDNCEGSITATTSSPLSYTTQGTFTIVWTYDDGNGNTSTQNQTVIVDDVSAPVVTLVGAANVTLECGATAFQDPGTTVTDNCDEPTVTRTGSVDFDTPGDYIITYMATDMSDNTSAAVTRTVVVPTEEECSSCVQDLMITAALLSMDPHASVFSADNSITMDGIITSDEQITLSAPNGIEFLGSAAAQMEVESGAQLEVNLESCTALLISLMRATSER